MTRKWRAAELLATLVVLVVVERSAAAQAPPAPVYGPEAPAAAKDLEALKAELAAEKQAQAARDQKRDEQLKQLQEELQAERSARELERREAVEKFDETKKALQGLPLVRAGRFGLTLSGFVQADATAWRQSSQDELNPSTGNPLNETRFNLRRARLRAEIDYSVIGGALELDANTNSGPQVRVVGAEVSLKWRNPKAPTLPYLQLTIGEFKTPFGYEILQSDRDRLFLERSNAERGLFPGEYDLGVRLSGGWRFLRYAVAAMNGDPIGEKLFPGRDPNESKDFVGRVGVDFDILKRFGFKAGFSADYGTGFHKGVAASKNTIGWNDLNEDGAIQTNEISITPAQSPEPSKNFDRWGVGGDLLVNIGIPVLGDLTLYGELYFATNLDRALQLADPVAQGRDLRELGWYVAFTQELTPWAMIGVRYDRYDPDRDSNRLSTGVQVPYDSTYSTLSVAGAVRFPGYARLVLEYQHNGNALGRATNGQPTTLADDLITLRGQVQF